MSLLFVFPFSLEFSLFALFLCIRSFFCSFLFLNLLSLVVLSTSSFSFLYDSWITHFRFLDRSLSKAITTRLIFIESKHIGKTWKKHETQTSRNFATHSLFLPFQFLSVLCLRAFFFFFFSSFDFGVMFLVHKPQKKTKKSCQIRFSVSCIYPCFLLLRLFYPLESIPMMRRKYVSLPFRLVDPLAFSFLSLAAPFFHAGFDLFRRVFLCRNNFSVLSVCSLVDLPLLVFVFVVGSVCIRVYLGWESELKNE